MSQSDLTMKDVTTAPPPMLNLSDNDKMTVGETWPIRDVNALFELPLNELMFRAQQIHRVHFDPTEVELATLLSIKSGGCEEDCGYCP